jgi:hypothetical protein
MTDNVDLPLFQQYQLQFAGHIRNPQHTPRPALVPARRMQVYKQIVFANIESSLAHCFPVCKRAIGKRLWNRLIRGFFAHHQSHSPLFRQIPEEFLVCLQQVHTFEDIPPLPCYFQSLAHYEWIELAVSALETEADLVALDADGDLLTGNVILTPTLKLLTYDYPVHRISPKLKPEASLAEPVHLAVYRDMDDEVRFVEINHLTFRLLQQLETKANSGQQALEKLAAEMQYSPAQLIEFGLPVLQALKSQQLILGTALKP